MSKKKSIIMAVLILIIGSFSVNAQSLDNLRYEAEERKAEEAYWEAVSIMYRCILFDPINNGTCTPCFCYPLLDLVWVHTFVGSDNNLCVNIFYDNNGKVGELFYTAIIQRYEATKFTENTGSVVPSIEMKLDNGNLTFIQDETDLYKFDIIIW